MSSVDDSERHVPPSIRPRVSVVIPTYNRADLVVRAIESVVRQQLPDVEIVVVDDGSTDATPSVLRSIASSTPGLVHVRQDNEGVVAARNHGLRLARGEHIAFLDSDDEWMPDKLRVQLDVLDGCPAVGMCWTDMSKVGPDGHVITERHLRRMYTAYRRNDEAALFPHRRTVREFGSYDEPLASAVVRIGNVFPAIVRGSLVHTSTVVLRASLAERLGGFDPALAPAGEDFDYHLRTARLAPVALVDHPLVRYRVGAEDQLTRPELEIEIAANFLATVDKAVAAGVDGSAPRVPPADARAARAEAMRWIARLQLTEGHRIAAIRHAAAAVRLAPTGRRQLEMLGRTLAPRRLESWTRTRALRRRSV